MSARKLTLSHMANAISLTRDGESTDPDDLLPDQMRLFSYYKPGLMANNYVIEARQHISAPVDSGTQTLDILNTRLLNTTNSLDPQEFEVIVPRFSLDPTLINTYYPPDGHQDEGRILPHIVLEDPHYPWEISAGVKTHMDGKIDEQKLTDAVTGKPIMDPLTKEQKVTYRGMVPWVALLVFDPQDLHLPKLSDITTLNIPGFTKETDVTSQNPKGTFNMNISDYFTIPEASRINYKAKYIKQDGTLDDTDYDELTGTVGKVDVIFPPKSLFSQIFATEKDTDELKMGVEALKYLTHVRQINTTGIPDAGINEKGLYSIIISSRTGVYDQPAPQTQICHLVSIENVDSTLGAHLSSGSESDRVGMISLFSWVYTALPPNPVNFVDTMRNLTENQQMLRTNDNLLENLEATLSNDKTPQTLASAALTARLKLGYTLARWRPQSGEETVAFNRGPLVPQPVTWPGDTPISDLPDCSTTSQDYQILDPQTALMDLSYASAWQAGKLLAISDTVFSAALMRFRSTVHNSSANAARMEANKMVPKSALFANMKQSVTAVHDLSQGQTGDPQRLRPPSTATPAPDVKHPDIVAIMAANIKASTQSNASSGPLTPSSGQAIYDEFNLNGANNSDWAIIHTWLAEKLSLGGIPPQYLIPEPSFCQPESLRFFYIDDFWLDCLIDGALSVANHLDKDDDLVRREIKETFNIYLRNVVPDAGFKPQIPCYGFIIRSTLIKAMPDLRITVVWNPPDNRHPVCRWTKWDDETLMCLLDRQPQELDSITLAQPPHQQRFSLGSALDTHGHVTFDLRMLYTQGPPDEWPEKLMPDPTVANSWFEPSSRCLKLTKMAVDINGLLQFGLASDAQAYIDPIPNSCELGLELNDPSYYFKIVPPANAAVAARDRQLYVNQPSPRVISSSTGSPTATSTVTPSNPGAHASPVAPAKPPTSPPIPTPMPTAPHQQPLIQPQSQHNATTTKGVAVGTASLKSQFDLFVFPDYKGVPTRLTRGKFDSQDYVPTSNVYYFDLLFTIRKKPTSTDSSYQLLKLALDIPVLATPPNKTIPSLLTSNYDGPGIRMLSNQRFIPFLYSPDAKSTAPVMHVELVPRSAQDVYALPMNDLRTSEADFRLAEANISPMTVTIPTQIEGNDLMQKREQVTITLTEWYRTPAAPTGTPVVSTYTVIKWNTTDDTLITT
ncbi:hypothetical protein EG329_013475 [Mollisiaceae sp. DMI_Dod_QoI]|nr:hypothetical protein EG329_013475 [Helotiales sp. DMI_Dod_QoI]